MGSLKDWKEMKWVSISGPVNEEDLYFLGWLTINGNMEHLKLDEATGIKYIPKRCFEPSLHVDSTAKKDEKRQSKLLSMTLGQLMTEIRDSAFCDCKILERITLDDSLKRIDSYAFANCEKLKDIKHTDKIEELGEYAFFHCKSFRNEQLSLNLKRINRGCFMGCDSLGLVLLEENIKEIEEYAFLNTNIEFVVCKADKAPACDGNVFDIKPEKGGMLRIRPGKKNEYRKKVGFSLLENVYEDIHLAKDYKPTKK